MIFTAEDGTLLYSLSQRPARPKASLLVVHGLAEHSGRYDSFAEEWLQKGFAVHRIDLRGHGRSGGSRGHVDKFSQYHNDIEAWITHLESSGALTNDIPCFLLGHSLGGLIAAGFIANRTNILGIQIQGLVLSAPAFGVPPRPWTPLQRWLSDKVPSFFSKLQLPSGIAPEFLSHDKVVVQEFKDDPLVQNWVTPGFGRSLFNELDRLDRWAKKIRLPLLVLLAGEDKIVSNRATESFVSQIRKEHPQLLVSLKRFPGSYHEIFNETAYRHKAFVTIEDWMNSCLRSQEQSQTPKRSKASSSKSSKTKAIGKATSL